MAFSDAKLIIFDLDSTLAESKSKLTPTMTELVQNLLRKKKVGVISGGNFPQFEKQFIIKHCFIYHHCICNCH